MADLEALKKLRVKYAGAIPAKLKEIEILVKALEQEVNLFDLEELKVAVHKIAGNAGGYGFMKASTLSAQFEAALYDNIQDFLVDGPNPLWINDFKEYSRKLKAAFDEDLKLWL